MSEPNDEREYEVLDPAERSIIQRRGRRRVLGGALMIFSGVLIGPACLASAIWDARHDKPTAAIVLGSVSVVGFGLLGGGIPLVVRGRKMNRHPERYPLALSVGGGGLMLRF